MQIVGKIRLALAPMQNHWWQVTFYVTSRGLTTSPMPSGEGSITVEFDFLHHVLHIETSDGTARALPLVAQPVADFYATLFSELRALGHEVTIRPRPVEMEVIVPFPDDRAHASYDAEAAGRWWRIVAYTDRVMKEFRGEFLGKSSPVHFFWGGFDLAVTRFSGKPAPRWRGVVPNCPDHVMWEAYSHECSSCGFWPGGTGLEQPAFYSYAYPEPTGYKNRVLDVPGAFYHPALGEFILPYDTVRNTAAPDEKLLQFFRCAYDAAADLGHWDRAALERRLPSHC